MADFCKQCSEEIFGEDFRDLVNSEFVGGRVRTVLCEECGITVVDDDGACVSSECLKEHGGK